MPEKTKLELLIRSIVKIMQESQGKKPFAIIVSLGPMIALAPGVSAEISGKSREELGALFRDTLDNLIGNEVDALIGEKGSLIHGDVPFISNDMLETISDVILGYAAQQWVDAINPETITEGNET